MADHQGWLTPSICELLSWQLHNYDDRAAFRLTCKLVARVVRIDDPKAYPIFKWNPERDVHALSDLKWKGIFTRGSYDFAESDDECWVSFWYPMWEIIANITRGGSGKKGPLVQTQVPSKLFTFTINTCDLINVTVPQVIAAIYHGTISFGKYMEKNDKNNDAEWKSALTKFPELTCIRDYVCVYMYIGGLCYCYAMHKTNYADMMAELAELNELLGCEARVRQRAYLGKVRQGLFP